MVHFDELPPEAQTRLFARSPELRQMFAEEETSEEIAKLKKELERLKAKSKKPTKPKPPPKKNIDALFFFSILIAIVALIAQAIILLTL